LQLKNVILSWLLVQACQGFKLDDGIDCTDAEVDRDKDNIRRLPKQADFFYAYSTVRGTELGSCLIINQISSLVMKNILHCI
jgi:hypothetical protein